MKKLSTILFVLVGICTYAQQTYYNGINFNLRSIALKSELSDLIISTHTKKLSYSNVWDALKKTDIDPTDPTRVVQIYGYNKTSTGNDAYYNKVNNNGGNSGQWNREHTFAKSLGTPNLETSGPGADAHHLRASDVKRNSDRGNLKFIDGSGNSRKIGSGWYPGDEWKGDVARMMMYMYLRYETTCLPANVGFGSTSQTPDGMIDLFLKWNAEDPVSQFEIQRNEYLGDRNNAYAQGNRNPFIDNPYLATLIWGGPEAENKWPGFLNTSDINQNIIKSYTKENSILVATGNTAVKMIEVFNTNGQLINTYKNTKGLKTIELRNFEKGVYVLKISGDKVNLTQKVLIK